MLPLTAGIIWSPDGKRRAVSADDHTLKVWDLETGRDVAYFTCDSAAYRCAVSGRADLIVTGDAAATSTFSASKDRNADPSASARYLERTPRPPYRPLAADPAAAYCSAQAQPNVIATQHVHCAANASTISR
jgi:hypothetical protein